MNIFIDLPFREKGLIQTEITILLMEGAMRKKNLPFFEIDYLKGKIFSDIFFFFFFLNRANPGWKVESSSTVLCDRCP